jgi:hypothetical protein
VAFVPSVASVSNAENRKLHMYVLR